MRTRPIPARLVVLLVALLATSGSSTLAQNPPAPGPTSALKPLVLRGGLLIDGTGAAPVNNAVLVLSGGKIQAAGREGSVAIPPGATFVDTTGKTILPGLIDSHMHLRNFTLPSYLYWGVTSVGDLGNATGWILAYRDAIAKGRAVGPYIMATGAKVNSPLKPGDQIDGGDAGGLETFTMGNSQMAYVTDQASIVKALGTLKQQGVDAIKLYSRLDVAQLKMGAQEAHRLGLKAFSHYSDKISFDEAVDTGIDVQVHMYGLVVSTAPKELHDRILKGENVSAWHLLDTAKFPALAQKMVAAGMYINPTLRGQFGPVGKRRADFNRVNTAFLQSPLVAALPEFIRDRYAASFNMPRESAERAQERAEGFKRVGMFLKEFVDRGGKLIAGTDTGSAMPSTGLTLQEEMQLLTEVGIKPMQVIQAATSWSTEAWGKSKEFGTLEPGKRADLLVLNRNPLDDMSATTDIYRIIQGGSVVDREALGTKGNETLIRPTPMQTGAVPNFLIHVPFIHEISPDLLLMNQKNPAELTITGKNFSKDSFVLINDRIVPVKSQKEDELRVAIPPELAKKEGVYPLIVGRPGSGGAVSNVVYIVVSAS